MGFTIALIVHSLDRNPFFLRITYYALFIP